MYIETNFDLVYGIAALALVIGIYLVFCLRPDRFHGYRKVHLNYVNAAIASTVSIEALRVGVFVFSGQTLPFFSHAVGAFWTVATVMAVTQANTIRLVKIGAAAILIGYPIIVHAHSGGEVGFFDALNTYYFDAEEGLTRVQPSHIVKAIYYFVGVFAILNYYGAILKLRNSQLTRLKQASAFTSEAVNNTVAIATAVISIVASLFLVGVDVKVLSIITAIITAGVATIFRDLLTNVAAGLLLIIHGDIKANDVIEFSDFGAGVVRKITLRHTVITDRNEISVLVPNIEMLKNRIRHLTYNGAKTRLTTDIGIGYDADIDKAILIMQSVCFHVERVLATPMPTIQIRGANDFDVTLRLCFWIDTPDKGIGNVKSQVLHYLIREFNKYDIVIPYPIVELRGLNGIFHQPHTNGGE